MVKVSPFVLPPPGALLRAFLDPPFSSSKVGFGEDMEDEIWFPKHDERRRPVPVATLSQISSA